jgi:tetratricopeptide (TPR) repeat protein
MGTYFHAESDLWSQLLGQLTSKSLLLILDNIEQFMTVASDLIVDLLEAGDNVHLLVTSRTTLALASSFPFPLTGLETPTVVSAGALQNECVRLFAERAARMPAPFQPEKHLAEVVAICQFVEGMPLGIELAAASLGRLMIDEIMPALTGNLGLLNSTRRDLPPRQRTLHAVFNATWNLLNAREQALLAQVSVFRGGFTRQAVEMVIDDTTDLYNLQLHALLHRDETGRFRMHPLLHQLAREKLDGPNMIENAVGALNRHSIYFADLIGSFEDDLHRGIGQGALQIVLPEQANLRAAWQHAVQVGQWQTIANCLDSVHYFYQRKGFFSEEITLVDGAITTLQASMQADDVSLTGLLGRLMIVRARGYLNSAQFENGEKTAEQACELAQSLERPDLEARARLAWARILSRQHRREPALAQYEQAVTLAKIAQNPILEADGLIGIVNQVIWQADVQSVDEVLLHAFDLCQALQYKPGEMETLMLLGYQAGRKGEPADAVSYYRSALKLSRLLGDVVANAQALGSIGVWLTALGDLMGSQTHLSEALDIFRRLNMPESEQWVLGQLGYTSLQLGDYARAEKQLAEALVIAERLEDEFWQAWVGLRLGEMWNQQGKSEFGLSYLAGAYQTAEKLKYQHFKAAVLYAWGDVFLSRQDWVNAEQKYQEAYDLRHGAGRIEEALPALTGLAYVAYRQEKLETAAAQAEQLWQTWQASPAIADRANLRLYWMLGVVWDGLGDDRAADLWEKAQALLFERSKKIPDKRARKMFLEQVPAHRALLKVAI